MADVFSNFDTQVLLKNKHILFLGDSNLRAQYKDVVWLLKFNTLIEQKPLRSKLEESFLGDTLLERSRLHYGRDFNEVRLYYDPNSETTVEFIFLTRCYNRRLEDLFNDLQKKKRPTPDVIVMNSCLWDLTRWGPNGVPEYKDNMAKLMRLMKHTLPKECLVIWTTALPTAPHIRGGLLIKQIEFIEPMLRFEVMEANTFAREIVVNHGFDVLDNHYFMRMQMHRRAKDGVHYLPIPVRFMTNLLLTHIALTWNKKLPNNIKSLLLDKAIEFDSKPQEQPVVNIATAGIFSRMNIPSSLTVPKIRGLSITFSAEEYGSRKCNLFEYKLPAASSSETSARPRSVVQLPQDTLEPQNVTGPSRNRRKRKNRKKHHPYQNYQQYSYYTTHSRNETSFYNPHPNNDPYYGFYYGGYHYYNYRH